MKRGRLLPGLLRELEKEQAVPELAQHDSRFMEKVWSLRPSQLSQDEIDTRIEIFALRLQKSLASLRRNENERAPGAPDCPVPQVRP
jgi:hypothetical protein